MCVCVCVSVNVQLINFEIIIKGIEAFDYWTVITYFLMNMYIKRIVNILKIAFFRIMTFKKIRIDWTE